MSKPHPYGSWKSPITSELITSETIGLGQLALDGADIYWVEMRPAEAGRNVIVRRTPDGAIADVTPAPFNVRTRVHEYGGGAYTVHQGVVYFVHDGDQQLYCQTGEGEPRPLTEGSGLRFADLIVDTHHNRLICVREDHRQGEHQVVNTLVSVAIAPALDADPTHEGQVLVSGNDFYASPCLSPDGSQLAWLTWNHPNMPWDGTELWVATVQADGSLGEAQKVAGGPEESIFQPQWSPDKVLHFVSDRSGWWNLYRYDQGEVKSLASMNAEFGLPQWVFGMSTYGFAARDRLICTYNQQGIWQLAALNPITGDWEPLETQYTEISGIQVNPEQTVFLGNSPTEFTAIVQLLPNQELQVIRRASQTQIDPGYLSIPQTIEFPTENGLSAYGFYYPPQNRDFCPLPGERPPLLVKSHGGPTAATSSVLNLKIQYWTSRGIAVLDVNYGGSTGYGREYQLRLREQWGVVDVADCINGARYLVNQGQVDGDRLAITGGSAGGYTTLCALTFHDTFKAGASHYGVSDLEALAQETHKFEARYLDQLIGPYPEQRELYQQRSPIHFTKQLSCPVIFLQGLEDKIVPPSQAEAMVNALVAKGLPVAYITFSGEQHGFRQSENIRRALDSELYFYAQVFGFELAEPVTPVEIINLEATS